jgi:hypothetical protein
LPKSSIAWPRAIGKIQPATYRDIDRALKLMGGPMAEFVVCINRSTYYKVSAANEIEAIDHALDEGAEEIHQITLDAFLSSEAEINFQD